MKLPKLPWQGWALAAGVVVALVWGLWWLVFGRADAAVEAAATAVVGGTVAGKRGEAAVDATKIIERHYDRIETIKEVRDAGLANIRAAQDDAAGGAAARRALCLLDPASYGADPACRLPGAGS